MAKTPSIPLVRGKLEQAPPAEGKQQHLASKRGKQQCLPSKKGKQQCLSSKKGKQQCLSSKKGKQQCLPPDKGGSRGVSSQQKHIPYANNLKQKARENRQNPTAAEKKLWYKVLQNRQLLGYKFTRQKPLDAFIVDFYCAELRLAIELDGDSHATQVAYDEQRTEKLRRLGVQVLRFNNSDVLENIEGVFDALQQMLTTAPPP